MPALTQMTAHTLNPVKGWPRPNALDYHAKLSANVTFSPVYSGRVAHLNASGEYEMGVPDVVGETNMPLFLFQTSTDPDVANDLGGDPATDVDAFVQVTPSGNIMALVATGGYELESTEYNAALTYDPGDPLTATADNANATTGGRLTKASAAYTQVVCGIVSEGVKENGHRRNVLKFWSYFLPRQA